ncbi:MAG: response regulator [Candidatus Methylomirabilales bacterium]
MVEARGLTGQDTLAPFRALVVDDSAYARKCMAQVVTSLGGTVAGEAATGRQAVELYFALHPDLVLMDIAMPEMEGVEAVAAIINEDTSARIIMVTSVVHQEMVKRALGLGARHFIAKPFDFHRAGEIVRFVLTQSAQGAGGQG